MLLRVVQNFGFSFRKTGFKKIIGETGLVVFLGCFSIVVSVKHNCCSIYCVVGKMAFRCAIERLLSEKMAG